MSETIGELIWQYLACREAYDRAAAEHAWERTNPTMRGLRDNVKRAEMALFSEIKRIASEPLATL